MREGYFHFSAQHRDKADMIEEYPRPLVGRGAEGTIDQAQGLRSAWYSAECLIEGDDRDINVSLAFGNRVLRLELSALGI
jgi:hypothetical protein